MASSLPLVRRFSKEQDLLWNRGMKKDRIMVLLCRYADHTTNNVEELVVTIENLYFLTLWFPFLLLGSSMILNSINTGPVTTHRPLGFCIASNTASLAVEVNGVGSRNYHIGDGFQHPRVEMSGTESGQSTGHVHVIGPKHACIGIGPMEDVLYRVGSARLEARNLSMKKSDVGSRQRTTRGTRYMYSTPY